jgi:hypothetical protein
MSILVRYSPSSMTSEQYDETLRGVQEAGEFPPEGLEYHVCFGSNGKLEITEVWRSREQLEEFGQWLKPVLSRFGIDAGEAEVLEIHNILRA